MEPFENHLILGKSSWNTRQISNCLHPGALIIINSNDSYLAFCFVFFFWEFTIRHRLVSALLLLAETPVIFCQPGILEFLLKIEPQVSRGNYHPHSLGWSRGSVNQGAWLIPLAKRAARDIHEANQILSWRNLNLEQMDISTEDESSQETIPGVLMLTQPEPSWFFFFLKPSFALISRTFAIDSLLSHAHWMVERKLKPRSPHSALALNHYNNLVTWQMLNCEAVLWGVVSRSGLEARLSWVQSLLLPLCAPDKSLNHQVT